MGKRVKKLTSATAKPSTVDTTPAAATPAAANSQLPTLNSQAPLAPIMPLLGFGRRLVESPARFNWSNWSRQTGKSFYGSLRRIIRGVERRRLQVFLSAGERQSRELMIKARQHCEALQLATQFIDDQLFEGTSYKQLEIQLPNGVRIIGLPANPQTARGFTGDVFLDEFALHKDDRAIWGALFPTIMRNNGELDVASTPKGKNNTFYRLGQNLAFEHTTVTIHDAVADGLKVDVDEIRAAMGDEELFRQEFECEFVDEATAFLTYEMIAACERAELDPPIKLNGERDDVLAILNSQLSTLDGLGPCCLGVDIGRQRDLTVLWLAEKRDRQLITRAVFELARVPFRVQCEALSMLLRIHREGGYLIGRAAIDATGLGMQLAEQAVEDFGVWRVDNVTFTQSIKSKLAGQLRIKVEDRSLAIPADAAIRNDWHSVEKMVTTGGNVLYRAERGPGGHADRFWAAALCVDAAGVEQTPWRGEIVSVMHEVRRRVEPPEMDRWEPDDKGRRRWRRELAAV